jgi:hypothetical protein
MKKNEVAMASIIKDLSMELAKRDYAELESTLKGMNFETALKTFNGFNLRADPITSNGICIGVNMFFECRYKSIQVTIFKTDDISCELGESCNVHINGRKVCWVTIF